VKGQFLFCAQNAYGERNVYADKSSLILEWLLQEGVGKDPFSIREVARDSGVSVGLVQGVFSALVMDGYLQTIGVRTAKKFILKKPADLLRSWLEHYSVVKKCKMRTYRTGFQGPEQVIAALKKAHLQKNVTLALHSAADVLECKNTNLQTLELYLLRPNLRARVEKILQLEPQERGYEVLLLEPYYKTMLKRKNTPKGSLVHSSALLTFLDLYHFPLRGQEQAEFMAERVPELRRIFKRG